MHLKFLPYKLEPCLNNYKRELLFIGVSYYERYIIFEHLNKNINQVLGFDIERVELGFEVDKLVWVWLYIKESKLVELVNVFESYYGTAPTKVNLEFFADPPNTMQYYWSNSQYLVGLGDNVYEDICYVYVTLKNCNLYFTQDE
ncbi:MAG: hypothetical protein ABJB11_08865 [Ferruginibacter sp.]